MKQFQFEYKNINYFRRELARVKRFCSITVHSSVFFQVFTQCDNLGEIEEITKQFESEFPEAYYYGCQSFGNIIDGRLSKDKTLIVCSVFEYDTTKTKLVYIDPTDKNARFQTLDDLWQYCNGLGWVKAVELTVTYYAGELLKIGETPISLNEGIQVFGGVAIYPNDIVTQQSYLFTKKEGFSDKAAVAILLGGEDLHVSCSHNNGWEGLGKHFTITKCEGKIIHEIDYEPAMDIYRKYLGIDYNERFLEDTMKFPLLVNEHGVDCIRMPMPTKNRDDIELTVNVENGTKLRLSCGEPSMLIQTINRHVREIYEFAPETIRIYSCAVRRIFWGDDRISQETSMLDGIAGTVGFYTRGELLRVGDYLQYFNATIVTCLVREGEVVKPDYALEEIMDTDADTSVFSAKLLHYLGAVTGEIESQYARTITGFAQAFITMLSIDLKENTITELDHDKITEQCLQRDLPAREQLLRFVELCTAKSHLESIKSFCDLNTIRRRMNGLVHIEQEFLGKTVGWFRAQFVALSYDDRGEPEEILFTTQIIDADKKREEHLRYLTVTDTQTGLYNRRSYEEDIKALRTASAEERYTYILVDINGLKTTNDTLGHAAGDELIRGTAACMKLALGSYGKVYRIGGDEFAAIIYVSGRHLPQVKEDFQKLVGEWKGTLVKGLSVAAGYVARRDVPELSIDEIEKRADELMYQDKERYYLAHGGKR